MLFPCSSVRILSCFIVKIKSPLLSWGYLFDTKGKPLVINGPQQSLHQRDFGGQQNREMAKMDVTNAPKERKICPPFQICIFWRAVNCTRIFLSFPKHHQKNLVWGRIWTCEKDDRPDSGDSPGHPTPWQGLHGAQPLLHHPVHLGDDQLWSSWRPPPSLIVHLHPLPDPAQHKAVLQEEVCRDHQDDPAVQWRPEDSQPLLQDHLSTFQCVWWEMTWKYKLRRARVRPLARRTPRVSQAEGGV